MTKDDVRLIAARFVKALLKPNKSESLDAEAIANALTRSAAGTPHTAYEIYARKCARELLAAWKSGDMQTFDRLVRHDQGYP